MENIEENVNEIILKGNKDEAKRYFYQKTYFLNVNPEYDMKFRSLFLTTNEDNEVISNELLIGIQSNDEKKKLDSLKLIRKAAYDETSIFRERWLANPLTIDIFLKLLENENNNTTILEIFRILGMICNRYGYVDARIYKISCAFFKKKNKNIDNEVINTISSFDLIDKWNYVYEFMKSKPNKYGQSVLGSVITKFGKDIPFELKNKITNLLFDIYKNYSDSDYFLIQAIGESGDNSILKRLNDEFNASNDFTVKEYINNAIASIKARE